MSEAKIKLLLRSYENNKEDLKTLEEFYESAGYVQDGEIKPSDMFEQGYNNALEFVFRLLGVQYEG